MISRMLVSRLDSTIVVECLDFRFEVLIVTTTIEDRLAKVERELEQLKNVVASCPTAKNSNHSLSRG